MRRPSYPRCSRRDQGSRRTSTASGSTCTSTARRACSPGSGRCARCCDAAGLAAVPLYITEIGWSTRPDEPALGTRSGRRRGCGRRTSPARSRRSGTRTAGSARSSSTRGSHRSVIRGTSRTGTGSTRRRGGGRRRSADVAALHERDPTRVGAVGCAGGGLWRMTRAARQVARSHDDGPCHGHRPRRTPSCCVRTLARCLDR